MFAVINFVYAQYSTFSADELKEGANQVVGWIKAIFGPFFEAILGTRSYDSFFYAKVLLLILLYALISFILNKIDLFQGRGGVISIVAGVISVLAVRFLQENDFVRGILLPTGALGISLIVILPILIYFFFVHEYIKGSSGRRIAWMFFFVVFCAIWLKRRTEIPSDLNWIYSLGIIIVGINFLFDSQIHQYFELAALKRWNQKLRDREVAKLQAEYNLLYNTTPRTSDIQRRLRQIWLDLKRLNGTEGLIPP